MIIIVDRMEMHIWLASSNDSGSRQFGCTKDYKRKFFEVSKYISSSFAYKSI